LTKNHSVENITMRGYWLELLQKIAEPVIMNASMNSLRQKLPVEQKANANRNEPSVLESFARTLLGLAPWLETKLSDNKEAELQSKYRDMVLKGIENAVNPTSPDFMFSFNHSQYLVDTAFFAQALMLANTQIWHKLSEAIQSQIVQLFKESRKIVPHYSNWLLFSATIEAFLMKIQKDPDLVRIEYALHKHFDFYKGDGTYGDGDDFHWDYYNSFVIQPMLLDITDVYNQSITIPKSLFETIVPRAQRFAQVQELMIMTDGSFPAIGRSVCYRSGVFHLLSRMAMRKQLPENLSPAQVRFALTTMLKRVFESPANFDKQGWLTIGLSGHQPSLGESYISTGSLYLCCTIFHVLGLDISDPFWKNENENWSAIKIWNGEDIEADRALYK